MLLSPRADCGHDNGAAVMPVVCGVGRLPPVELLPVRCAPEQHRGGERSKDEVEDGAHGAELLARRRRLGEADRERDHLEQHAQDVDADAQEHYTRD